MAIALVGTPVKAKSTGSAASVGVSVSVTSGNRIIACAFAQSTQAAVGAASGSVSGSMTKDLAFADQSGVAIFSVIAAATGTETITFTPTASALIGIVVGEFSGTASSAYLDVTGTASDISATATLTAGITPTVSGCVVIGAVAIGSATAVTLTLPSGYTLLEQIESDGNTGEGEGDYVIQTTAVSTNPSWTISTGVWWAVAVAAYKESAGGGGGASAVLARPRSRPFPFKPGSPASRNAPYR